MTMLGFSVSGVENWKLVCPPNLPHIPRTTLREGIVANTTTIPVDSLDGFSSDSNFVSNSNCLLLVDDLNFPNYYELIKYSNTDLEHKNFINCNRGQFNTSARSWPAGTYVVQVLWRFDSPPEFPLQLRERGFFIESTGYVNSPDDIPPPQVHGGGWTYVRGLNDSINKIYMFGGYDPNAASKRSDELWEFDLGTKKWKKLEKNGDIPSARAACGLAYHSGSIYIFGGNKIENGQEVLLKEIFKYDLTSKSWSHTGQNMTYANTHGVAFSFDTNYTGSNNNPYQNYIIYFAYRQSSSIAYNAYVYDVVSNYLSWWYVHEGNTTVFLFQGNVAPIWGTPDFIFAGVKSDGGSLSDPRSPYVGMGYVVTEGSLTRLKMAPYPRDNLPNEPHHSPGVWVDYASDTDTSKQYFYVVGGSDKDNITQYNRVYKGKVGTRGLRESISEVGTHDFSSCYVMSSGIILDREMNTPTPATIFCKNLYSPALGFDIYNIPRAVLRSAKYALSSLPPEAGKIVIQANEDPSREANRVDVYLSGSVDSINWSEFSLVKDGNEIPPYKFFRFEMDFTSNKFTTAQLLRIAVGYELPEEEEEPPREITRGGTFYVDPFDGDDFTGNGTLEAPFKTIKGLLDAIEHLEVTDKIIVLGTVVGQPNYTYKLFDTYFWYDEDESRFVRLMKTLQYAGFVPVEVSLLTLRRNQYVRTAVELGRFTSVLGMSNWRSLDYKKFHRRVVDVWFAFVTPGTKKSLSSIVRGYTGYPPIITKLAQYPGYWILGESYLDQSPGETYIPSRYGYAAGIVVDIFSTKDLLPEEKKELTNLLRLNVHGAPIKCNLYEEFPSAILYISKGTEIFDNLILFNMKDQDGIITPIKEGVVAELRTYPIKVSHLCELNKEIQIEIGDRILTENLEVNTYYRFGNNYDLSDPSWGPFKVFSRSYPTLKREGNFIQLRIVVQKLIRANDYEFVSIIIKGDPLTIIPNEREVAPLSSFQFIVSGGIPPYSFFIVSNETNATITEDGKYTAGNSHGIDIVKVTDAEDNEAVSVIKVIL